VGRLKTLGHDSSYSKDTLQRVFYAYLEQSPTVGIIKRDRVHLRMDATYFNHFCLLCYQDEEIKEDLDNLIRLGVQIESIALPPMDTKAF
jgi:hypothetical protein